MGAARYAIPLHEFIPLSAVLCVIWDICTVFSVSFYAEVAGAEGAYAERLAQRGLVCVIGDIAGLLSVSFYAEVAGVELQGAGRHGSDA